MVFDLFQAAIWHCLNHYSYNDAIFLAERLYAEGWYIFKIQKVLHCICLFCDAIILLKSFILVESDECLFLLATCYYRSGQVSMAYSTLKKKDSHSPQSRCLLAKCCVDLQK